MKNKKGFTLAEVLITLGIIGVVAALTMPALNANVGQSKIGPSLSKFVNTFENGARQYMTENEISSISAIPFDEESKNLSESTFSMGSVLDNLSKYIIWAGIEETTFENYIKTIKKGDGTSLSSNMAFSYKNTRIMKDGGLAIFLYPDFTWRGQKGSLNEPRAIVLYDINGLSGPNTLAKDVFAFALDSTGILVPYGSSMYKNASGETIECNPKGGKQANYACTGSVADNGWKAKY